MVFFSRKWWDTEGGYLLGTHPGREWQYVLMVVVVQQYTKRCCVDLYGPNVCSVEVIVCPASEWWCFFFCQRWEQNRLDGRWLCTQYERMICLEHCTLFCNIQRGCHVDFLYPGRTFINQGKVSDMT